jgi:hypothetical protein
VRAVRCGADGRQDYFENAAEILDHVIIPETQHTPAMLLKPSCAVRLIPSDRAVLTTIEFDDQRSVFVNAIDDVPPDRYLASELKAG